MQQHRESQTNQYALVERAQALGWHPERIHVISADLGQSGQDSGRPGFQELVAEVSLGHVGIVLAYEASRLARNNADWYTLLDLAAVMGTLLADTDGVYDPRAYNDRLLLGLRGMFSEAELHLLHLRLEAGRMRQVERGSYQRQLPTGLQRLPDGQVVKDPDVGVQHALDLVFERFSALRSCQKVLRALRDEGICVPRRQTSGPAAGTLVWKRPTASAIYEIVGNSAYAGAFVFGRHGRAPAAAGGHGTRRVHRPLGTWTQVHREVYPAYISWGTFMANQAQLERQCQFLCAASAREPTQRHSPAGWTRGLREVAAARCTSRIAPAPTTSARPCRKSTADQAVCIWRDPQLTPRWWRHSSRRLPRRNFRCSMRSWPPGGPTMLTWLSSTRTR